MLHLLLGPQRKKKKLWDAFSTEESTIHINALEIKVVFSGLQLLYENIGTFCIHVQVDNTSAVAAINKMGKTQGPWIWIDNYTGYGIGLKKNCTTATHVPGVLNVKTNKKSRNHKVTIE